MNVRLDTSTAHYLQVSALMGIDKIGRRERRLYANQIQLNLCEALLACPKIQRSCVDFVNEGCSESNLSQINSFDVMLAGVTCFDTHMIELR